MTREYYQMGWTLAEQYDEKYYFSKDSDKYFIKKNATPLIAALSAERIVPKLKWTRRLSNGDVIIAQDFEYGRTLLTEDMKDKRIPQMLKKVHNSEKLKKIMDLQGYNGETAKSSFQNLSHILSSDLLKNKDITNAYSYLEKNIPRNDVFAPCHADLHKDNWLLSDKGTLFLVDWEDAILGDPAIDISFILYKYIPQEDWDEWLKIYGVKADIHYRQKLKWYIVLQSLIMITWYYEKCQLSKMNEWLLFLNKVFIEYI